MKQLDRSWPRPGRPPGTGPPRHREALGKRIWSGYTGYIDLIRGVLSR